MPSWPNKVRRWCVAQATLGACRLAPLPFALFVGCHSMSITHEMDELPTNALLGGRYDISGIDAPLAAVLRKQAPKSITFTHEGDPAAMPLKVLVLNDEEQRDTTSAIQILPFAFSLTILPGCFEKRNNCTIRVESPSHRHQVVVVLVERELFSSLPLGWIPCAFPLDEYGCTLSWEKNDRNRRELKETVREAALPNIVAQCVLPMLTQAHYEEYIAWKTRQDEAKKVALVRKRKIASALERETVLRQTETGWHNEAKLRELALKEMPEIWDIIVERRVKVAERRTNLIRLRRLMKESGEVPENDAGYVAGRSKYDEERILLVNIFRILEKTYLVICKNELAHGNAETNVQRSKAIDQCVQEILALVNKDSSGNNH